MTHSIKGKQNKQRKRKSIKKIPMYFLPFISFGFFGFSFIFHTHSCKNMYAHFIYVGICILFLIIKKGKQNNEFGVFFYNAQQKKKK